DYLGWLAWSADSRTVYGLRLYPERTDVVAVDADTGRSRSIYSASELLMEASWARDARSFVAIRQNSFTPDELVRIDVTTGRVRSLASPNAGFTRKLMPTVRFMRVNNPLGGGIFGRLVLPHRYVAGTRYPLVFTTYRAGAGFLEGAVGDEFP